jgi:hypothetical protein
MGMFWELFQEFQINKRKRENGTVEERIAALEKELDFVESLLARTLEKLEQLTGEDFSNTTEATDA